MQPSLTAYIIDTYARASAATTGKPYQLNFDYFPEGYDEGKSAQYANIDIMGRSEPIKGYMSSSARNFQINFRVGIDVLSPAPGPPAPQVVGVDPTYGTAYQPTFVGDTAKSNLLLEKKRKLDFLLALLYPDYNATGIGMVRTPPPILVIIGSYFCMLGVALDIRFRHEAPYDPDTGISHWTNVSLVVEETAANPFSYLDIQAGRQSINTGSSQT